MGIYIKGMEMPKSCVECEFCYWSNLQQENICDKYDYTPVGDRFQHERANFCPLTEVPEPHGRLIDADALYEHITNKVGGVDCAVLLDNEIAPTVIESEVEE